LTREEANARILELSAVAKTALEEMHRICREHGFDYTFKLNTQGMYTQNIEVGRYADEPMNTWVSSDEYWNDSGCSIEEDWNDSGCII
jgi:hypothetical protein